MDEIQIRIIERTKQFVKQRLENDFSGHDYSHALRVNNMALFLAREECADMFIVSMAALLHDVDDRKIFTNTWKKKNVTHLYLESIQLPMHSVNHILIIIDAISFSGDGAKVPTTIEGKCVQDADRLDALGAIGIARTFAYGGCFRRRIFDPNIVPRDNIDVDNYYNDESTTINHFYEKLLKLKGLMNTETAYSIAEKRTIYMENFLSEFYEEWFYNP